MEIGFGEMILILALALILLGPKRLPGAARSMGRIFYGFKREVGGFFDENK